MNDLKLKPEPTPGKEFVKILRKLSVPSDFILFCKFRGKLDDCTKLFKETITDDGICFTFNMLESKDMFKSNENDKEDAVWSIPSGYRRKGFEVYPYRAFSGVDVGMNIVLNLQTSDLDYLCRGPVQGYKIKIHSPDEHPRMATGYQRIPLNSEVLIAAKPEVNLRSYRDFCHSSSSKPLKLFKDYSQANCITECLSQYVLSQCGCVKFTMVHDNETNICNQHDTTCVSKAMDGFSMTQTFEEDFPCDCRPACDLLKFNTKVTQAAFDFKNVFTAFEEDASEEFLSSTMSRLVVYLEENTYVEKTYATKDTAYDIIAKIGGVIAFFLGASVISIIEIFFYFLRRFIC